jgi:hypothetical protein
MIVASIIPRGLIENDSQSRFAFLRAHVATLRHGNMLSGIAHRAARITSPASRVASRGSRRQLRASRRADHVASFARRVARITSPASRLCR